MKISLATNCSGPNPDLPLSRKVQLTGGICAAKASRHLPGLLCGRFHDPEYVHIIIPGVSIRSRRKFCIQEVLMHVTAVRSYNALFGLLIITPDTVYSL